MALALDSRNIGEGQFHEALGRYAFTDIYKKKLDSLRNLLSAGAGVGIEQVVYDLGNGVQAFESVPTAISCC